MSLYNDIVWLASVSDNSLAHSVMQYREPSYKEVMRMRVINSLFLYHWHS